MSATLFVDLPVNTKFLLAMEFLPMGEAWRLTHRYVKVASGRILNHNTVRIYPALNDGLLMPGNLKVLPLTGWPFHIGPCSGCYRTAPVNIATQHETVLGFFCGDCFELINHDEDYHPRYSIPQRCYYADDPSPSEETAIRHFEDRFDGTELDLLGGDPEWGYDSKGESQ